MREKQRKVLANFDKRGFFLTGTYEDCYLPDDEAACWKDVENYARRVKYATCKRFGVEKEKIRLMLWAARKGEAGRLHMHGFAQCVGMGEADRREWREMLEDLWRRRIPGTREFEPLGTMNVDRMDMKKLLGLSGEGKNGTLGYIYGHSWRRCLETRNLISCPRSRDLTTAGGAASSCTRAAPTVRTAPTGGSSGTRAGSA